MLDTGEDSLVPMRRMGTHPRLRCRPEIIKQNRAE